MRFVVFVLAALTVGPALAQQSDRPLPPPAVITEFLRSAFSELFTDVSALEPLAEPGTFRATTNSPDLPQFEVRVSELTSNELTLRKVADAALGPDRNTCQPWRLRGEGDQPDGIRLLAQTMLCPAGDDYRLVWVLVLLKDSTARLLMVSAPGTQSVALVARGDRQMAALGMTSAFWPRSLAEAVMIARAHSGFATLYEPSDATLPSPTSAVLQMKVMSATGNPGAYEVDAPDCSTITIREIIAGPPRVVETETRIDLQALRRLLTREGINVRARAGSYGQENLLSVLDADGRPIGMDQQTEEGVLDPDSTWYPTLDSYLLAAERFCGEPAPDGTQAPGTSSSP